MAHLEAPIPALPAGHGVPTEIEGVLRRLLAKRPEDRYRSAREFVKALDDAAPAATDRHPTRRWPPKRRHVVLAAGLIAAVAACSMIAMLARPDRGQPPKEFATKPLTLTSLAVGHYRVRADKGLDDLGAIGPSGEPVRVGDDVRVELVLSEPAYAYLLALNTDGTVQLCLPESDDQPPPRADRLVLYPSDSDYFTLKEGRGCRGSWRSPRGGRCPPTATGGSIPRPCTGVTWRGPGSGGTPVSRSPRTCPPASGRGSSQAAARGG